MSALERVGAGIVAWGLLVATVLAGAVWRLHLFPERETVSNYANMDGTHTPRYVEHYTAHITVLIVGAGLVGLGLVVWLVAKVVRDGNR